MEKIQVSFSGNANLEVVKVQLMKLAEMKDVEFIGCFINRKMVIEKRFSTDRTDLLEKTLGNKLSWAADGYSNYNDFMKNIDDARAKVAKQVDKIYVLGSEIAESVARKIELCTMGRVVFM